MQQPQFAFTDLKHILNEGWLEKQSRFLKQWKKRWCVLTETTFYTFELEKTYKDPTEIIQLHKAISIKTSEDETKVQNSFKIETNEQVFQFRPESREEKESWISSIGKAMVKISLKQQ
ncbi:hypothetical protein pb186bvf_013021 [Paramecium bursaria]